MWRAGAVIDRTSHWMEALPLANTAAPRRGQPWQEPPAAAAPTPPPAASDPGTVFPGKPARCFARPGEAYSSRYPQRNRRLPAWQRDYTFFAAGRDQEAGGALWAPQVGAAYAPLHSKSPTCDTSVQSNISRTSFTPVFTVTVMYTCIARIKSVYSCSLY